MYKQKTQWAWRSVIVTILSVLLFSGLGLYLLTTDTEAAYLSYVLLGSLVILCFCSLFFFPLEIQVTPKSLNIVFPLYVKEIPLMDISRAEPYKVTMNFARIFGSGAFFGWWGWFHNQELGRFMVYATNLGHVFLIETGKGKKYVISCRDPETMCSKIRNAIHSK